MADPYLPHAADPDVSRAKFDHELAAYRHHRDLYIRRGWWLVHADFPEVFVVMGTSRAWPAFVPFGVRLDFTGYDLVPPSVTLVNPFTRQPLTHAELTAIAMPPPGPGAPLTILGRAELKPAEDGQMIVVSDLLQGVTDDPSVTPFVCLPGVREYHQHPAHTDDPWNAHRGTGEGTLYFLLDTIARHGVDPITGLAVQVQTRPARDWTLG